MQGRMTKKKRQVLETLAELGCDYPEYGTLPYNVARIAESMGADLANLSKTMQALARDGLVVREVRSVDCWNAIAGNHQPRRCACYWLAETMAQDKARAKAWRAGDRAAAALEGMTRLFRQ